MPTLREVFGFQYNRLTHLLLLCVLFAVSLAHLVIAAVADFLFAYALGIIFPVLAIAICCLRMLPAAKKIAGLHSGTVVIELVAYVLNWLLNAASLGYMCYGLSAGVHERSQVDERAAMMRIVCTVLELALEALLVYKLLPAILHSRWFRLWRGLRLHEREAEGTGSRVAAGSSSGASEHVDAAGEYELPHTQPQAHEPEVISHEKLSFGSLVAIASQHFDGQVAVDCGTLPSAL